MADKPTYEELQQKVGVLEKEAEKRDRELEDYLRELTYGLSEVFEALKKISSGDPSVKIPETSELELIIKLKQFINMTGENLAEIINLSHEFAIGLAEHFDVLHKVSTGDLCARVEGESEVELLEALKKVTNGMIESVSTEITHRKQAENKSRRKTAFLNLVLESLPHPFYVIDASDYTIKLANSAAHKGSLPEKITCHALTHKSDRPCSSADHPCPLETIKRTKQPVVLEHLHYDKDGNPRNVEVHGYPIFDEQGNLSQIIESSVDITERKKAEDALRESENKYSILVNNSPTGIYIDDNGKIVYANQRLSEIYGYPIKELLGIESRQLVHPDDRCMTDRIRQKRLNGQDAPPEYQARGITKDGQTLWINRRNTRIDYMGRPAILGNIVDVTERKQAEEALRASEAELRTSEEKYRTLFEYEPNSVFVLEPESLAIVDVNARGLACYGYEKEELIGKCFLDLGPGHFTDGVLATTEPTCSTLCSAYPKIQHRRKDGGFFFVDVYACQTKHSRKYGIIATTVDITDSLNRETQLIQASKMATLGEMATGVAHELNQPLSVIKTASGFLIRKIRKEEELKGEILLTLVEEIDSHVDRASKIINHMREFGRKSDVTKQKVAINEPLTKALEIFSQQLKLRDIEVIIQLGEDLPPILGDANRLEQVFINLLLNARDAIEDRWHTVEYGKADKKILLRTSRKGDRVVVEIEDTGSGIPETILDKVFEPFFTTKDVGKGTGLGLSISYGIIQDYGGGIEVMPRSGGGTCIIVTLPTVSEKA